MPRIRSLKPEAPQHRKVGRLSIGARWLWVVMITQADDEGRLVADPGQLRIAAFGYDLDVDEVKVAGWLAEIAASGLIRRWEVAGVPYADFPSWHDHQRIHKQHFTPSRLPAPPECGTDTVPVPYAYGTSPAGVEGILVDRKGKDRKGVEGKGGELEGRETRTGGRIPPNPPLLAHALSKPSNDNNPACKGKPAKGNYQDFLEAIRARHPDLPTAEAEEEALKLYNEHLMKARA